MIDDCVCSPAKLNRIELRRDGIGELSRRNRRSESEKRGNRDSDLIQRVLCCVNFGGRKELNATALFSFFLLLCNVFTILTFLPLNFLDKKNEMK
jgi:hypothetical protein